MLTRLIFTSIKPLLLEQGAIMPFNLLIYGLEGRIDLAVIVKVQALLFSLTVLFATFGLLIGGIVDGDSQRVTKVSHFFVFMSLIALPALVWAFQWPLLLVGILLWGCLVLKSGTKRLAALMLLFAVPFLDTFSKSLILPESWSWGSNLNPLIALREFPNVYDIQSYGWDRTYRDHYLDWNSIVYLCLSAVVFKLATKLIAVRKATA